MKTERGARAVAAIVALAAIAAVGCAEGADARPMQGAADAGEANGDVAEAANGTIRLTVAGTGNAARYRVREQLLGRDLPNDAVGETSEISGAITVDSSGAIVRGQSRFVVRTGAFKSDSDRRDGYVRRRLLQADSFPTVELVPTAARGLPARLPEPGAAAGPVTFTLVGDLTVRGVTRPTTWQVTARQANGRVTGTATTRFTFAQFSIDPPRVPVVLRVADTIALEYDFTLVREAAPAR